MLGNQSMFFLKLFGEFTLVMGGSREIGLNGLRGVQDSSVFCFSEKAR